MGTIYILGFSLALIPIPKLLLAWANKLCRWMSYWISCCSTPGSSEFTYYSHVVLRLHLSVFFLSRTAGSASSGSDRKIFSEVIFSYLTLGLNTCFVSFFPGRDGDRKAISRWRWNGTLLCPLMPLPVSLCLSWQAANIFHFTLEVTYETRWPCAS